MSEQATGQYALKDIFDEARFRHIAQETLAVWPEFDAGRFLALAFDGLDELGIMQRVRRTAECYRATLPDDFEKATEILGLLGPRVGHAFAGIALAEYVALYGQPHFDRSMDALRHLTRFGSAEFAIRPFLRDEPERTLNILRGFAEDENEHVRRLASEGSRPRLPWSFRLSAFAADPSLAFPILERLKADPSLYVRKSVANHLNDISKDHPDWLLDRLEAWPQEDPNTRWIVKHALRTLIKKGEPRALALVGATGEALVQVEGFSVTPETVRLGSHVTIAAEIVSTAEEPQHLVADYAVHYVKRNGTSSRKVFKLKSFDLPPGGQQALSIRRAIRDFSTRTHNAGHHRVDLMINGAVVAEGGFLLEA
ncbi:MAG: DNA alkylation repair protein [Rhizobiaceae bacterium]